MGKDSDTRCNLGQKKLQMDKPFKMIFLKVRVVGENFRLG